MKLPSRSFLFSACLTFTVAFALADVVDWVYTCVRDYDDYGDRRAQEVVNSLATGSLLLKFDAIPELKRRLEQSHLRGDIDFYILKHAGTTLFFENYGGSQSAIDIAYLPNQLVRQEHALYGAAAQGSYLLAVGVNRFPMAYVRAILKRERGVILGEIAFFCGMMFLIVFFFFREIGELIGSLIARKKAPIARGARRTIEAQIIASGINAYEGKIQGLVEEGERLRSQANLALRTEGDSGLAPPYEFDAVMIRTDINDYSSIRARHDVDAFEAVINEFFTQSAELIERHGGYVANLSGDEIIYYVKETDDSCAAGRAAALVRDIHSVAETLNRATEAKRGYPFRVKSAIVSGRLTYGAQVRGFALMGTPFIESARIFSIVDEKSENTVYLSAALVPKIGAIASATLKKEVELRGVPGRSKIFKLNAFTRVDEVLTGVTTLNAARLAYFRSDDDLARLLEFLRGKSREKPQEKSDVELVLAVLQAVRSISRPVHAERVIHAYAALLLDLLERSAGGDSQTLRLLSAAIGLAIPLIETGAFGSPVRELFLRCLRSGDRRVLSNAIDAFTHFEPDQDEKALERFVGHPDNRVMANALIKEGLLELDEQSVKRLRAMLTSKRALFIASGLYAIGELARRYREENPALFETHAEFQRLIQDVEPFTRHADAMIRRQANATAQKAGLVIRLAKIA